MKIINTKSLMVLSLFLTSMIAMPVMVSANDDNKFDFDQWGGSEGFVTGFQGGFGSMLGGLGYAGNLLGHVFLMLFHQAYENFSASEMLPGVFVLSAFNESSTPVRTNNFGPVGESEIHILPEFYAGLVGITGDDLVYCNVTKKGAYDYVLTVGVGITLVIWDNDHSFITAVKKLFSFFKTLEEADLDGEEIPEDLIREGVELITWFLIHINDIFTGDELFILNPITWQKLEITPHLDFEITKNWYYSDDNIIGDGDDTDYNDPLMLDLLNETALFNQDSYMQWLLRPTEDIPLATAIWTQFTFDLIELWVKNFEIHIDLAELVDIGTGEGGDFARAFGGCDIEFYLFTHHLAGVFLYNDFAPADGKISVNYTDVEVFIDGQPKNVSIPTSSELSHRLILNSVGKFDFTLPHKNPDNTISWGLELQNVNISAVPIGIDLDSYLAAPQENLAYAHFGFTFDPEKNVKGADAVGKIKLDQFFAPWNGPIGDANALIDGLDMAIIYVSTVLHFHLNVKTYSEATQGDVILDPEEDYIEESDELKIGNYLGGTEKLDFVDIAGPYYEYGTEDPAGRTQVNASTATIPLALWLYEMERHDTFIPPDETEVDPFATDIRVSINFTVLAYAVCYPMFNGTGTGIWHDPTFSVFMTFQAPEFWALIVLIAGIGLVGVATILIKRRKDMRV